MDSRQRAALESVFRPAQSARQGSVRMNGLYEGQKRLSQKIALITPKYTGNPRPAPLV